MLLFSKDKGELEMNTLRVLKKLRENNLFLNLDKCAFCVEKVEYLGMIISENKISIDKTKLAGILNWPVLTTIKQV